MTNSNSMNLSLKLQNPNLKIDIISTRRKGRRGRGGELETGLVYGGPGHRGDGHVGELSESGLKFNEPELLYSKPTPYHHHTIVQGPISKVNFQQQDKNFNQMIELNQSSEQQYESESQSILSIKSPTGINRQQGNYNSKVQLQPLDGPKNLMPLQQLQQYQQQQLLNQVTKDIDSEQIKSKKINFKKSKFSKSYYKETNSSKYRLRSCRTEDWGSPKRRIVNVHGDVDPFGGSSVQSVTENRLLKKKPQCQQTKLLALENGPPESPGPNCGPGTSGNQYGVTAVAVSPIPTNMIRKHSTAKDRFQSCNPDLHRTHHGKVMTEVKSSVNKFKLPTHIQRDTTTVRLVPLNRIMNTLNTGSAENVRGQPGYGRKKNLPAITVTLGHGHDHGG